MLEGREALDKDCSKIYHFGGVRETLLRVIPISHWRGGRTFVKAYSKVYHIGGGEGILSKGLFHNSWY